MKMTGNTILITGGGSGIGRGLAEAFHALGNKVIIAGRREHVLRETAEANPGMELLILDAADSGNVTNAAAELKKRFPTLNVLINNAGIMKPEDLLGASAGFADVEQTVAINLLAPLRLTAALLPQLQEQVSPVVMTVTSGLAFVPLAVTPTYCATKAAIHSWTQSLRFQLRHTPVEVLELIPPLRPDRTHGRAPGKRPAGHAARRVHRRSDVHLDHTTRGDRNLRAAGSPLARCGRGGPVEVQPVFTGFNEQMAAGHE